MGYGSAFDGVGYFVAIVVVAIFLMGYGCNSIVGDYDIKIVKEVKK